MMQDDNPRPPEAEPVAATAAPEAAGKRLDDLEREVAAARQAEAFEVAKAALLQARIFDLTQDNEQAALERARLADALEQHCSSIEATRAQVSALQEANGTLAARAAALEAERSDLRARATEQLARHAAALARMAEDLEAARTARSEAQALAARRQSELHFLTSTAEALQSQVRKAHKRAARKQAEIDALHLSTSWRITTPLRKAKDGLRRLTRRSAKQHD